jgi:hypothetical protein
MKESVGMWTGCTVSGQGPVVGSYSHCNETLGFVKGVEFG